jgi:DNA-binding NarL/FixJ family response regulator
MSICGTVAVCNRPLGHRGHHGGFRPINPLTPAETEVLRDYVRLGSYKDIAQERGTALHTIRCQIHNAYQKLGVESGIEAFVALGWLRVAA